MKEKNQKNVSFFLGLPAVILIFVCAAGLIVTILDNIKYADIVAVCAVSMAVLIAFGIWAFYAIRVSGRRKWAGVLMTVIGAILSTFFILAFGFFVVDVFTNPQYTSDPNGRQSMIIAFSAFGVLGVVFILLLIGGIKSLKTVKKLRAVSPWTKKHDKPVDFSKDGSKTNEGVIEDNYSTAFYDEANLSPFKVVFPDATIFYRQNAVLRIGDRLFVAGNDLSGNVRSELIFFFEIVVDENGKEKLNPVYAGTEEHTTLTEKYYVLTNGGLRPDTLREESQTGGSPATARANAINSTNDRIPVKARNVIMIIIFVLYGITLVLGILTATTGILDKAFSSTVEGATKEVGRAYGITMGLIWITAFPSVGYYVVFASPIDLKKRSKIIITICSIALSVIIDIVFFVVTKDYRTLLDSSDKWFLPFTVVAGSVCSFICFLLTSLRTNASSIRGIGGQSLSEANGLFEVLRAMFRDIVNFLLRVAAYILYFKDAFTTVYALIAALLFTLLLPFTTFVVAIIIIILAVCTLALFFAGFVSYSYDGTTNTAYSVYENGYERILTYHSHDTFRSRDVYRDDTGDYWYTNDNGETFYKD